MDGQVPSRRGRQGISSQELPHIFLSETFFFPFLSLSSFFSFFPLAGSHGPEASLQLTVWLSLVGNS